MVALHLFLRDEGHGGVIVGKVVRHLFDLLFDPGLVGALGRNHIAFAQVLLPCGQLRHGAAANRVQRCLDGHGVLPRVQHAVDAAHRVRVPLADAAAPERIVRAVRQDRRRIQAVQRKHARVPPAGNQRDMAALFGRRVHRVKVLRNVGVGVKRVDDVEITRKHRRHLRQVSGAAAADDDQVDLVFVLQQVGRRKDRGAGQGFDAFGRAPRKDADQLCVPGLADGALHAAPKVAVAVNCKFHYRSDLSYQFPSIIMIFSKMSTL